MKSRILLYFSLGLVSLCVTVGCTREHRQNELTRAYSLVNANPDSVLHLLQTINYRQLPQDEMAYYALLYTMAQDKSGLDVDQDTLLHYAHDYYSTRLQDTMYAKCMYYVGCYYLLNDSNKLAEDCFQDAIRSAEENKDYYTQYLALNRFSHSLRSSSPILALNSAKEAYRIYDTYCTPNDYNKVYLLSSIGNVLDNIHEYDSALVYYNNALALSIETGNEELISNSYKLKAIIYRKKSLNDSALHFAKIAQNIAKKTDESTILTLAECYISADSIEQSIALLNRLKESDDIGMKYRTLCLLRDCYYQLGKIQYGQQFSDSAVLVYHARYNKMMNERSQYLIDNIKLRAESNKKSFEVWLVYVVITILCFVLLAFIAKYKSDLRKKKMKDVDFDHLLCQLKDERELREQEHSEFKQHLQMQEKEFADKQLRLMRRYIFAKYNIDSTSTGGSKESLKPIKISEDDWIELTLFLNATANSFVERLIRDFPNLSENDIRFFMLLKLDLSIEALSRIYNIGINSVKQKQNKDKEKINLRDPLISLRAFLKSY